jgi:hypothetical protein
LLLAQWKESGGKIARQEILEYQVYIFCGAVAVFSQLARSIGLPRTHGDDNAMVLWQGGAQEKLVLVDFQALTEKY